MRRIVKPFTVEVRRSKRKPWPPQDGYEDQPVVEWPAELLRGLRPEPVVEPVPQQQQQQPPMRILPCLQAEPRRAVEPAPVIEPEEEVLLERPRPLPRDLEELRPVTLERAPAEPLPDASAPRIRRTRVSRSEFTRADRWKARLPSRLHGAHKTQI